MKTINQGFKAIHRRVRHFSKKTQLDLKYKINGGLVWIDYGWMKLPYHADGDQQELYYHLDGSGWWQKEKCILSPYIQPGSVVVDVGANLGFLTTLCSQLVGLNGYVHSFEPSPKTFRKLIEVIEANALKNVKSHNVGCGEMAAIMRLNITESSGNSSLRLRQDLPYRVKEIQEVDIVILDKHLDAQLSRLDFLKIDTEGFEDSVLWGARNLLMKFRPIIYLELSSEYLESSQRAVRILKELNYRFEQEPILQECHNGQNFLAFPR